MLEEMFGGLVGVVPSGTASSDATSSTQPTIISTTTCTLAAGDVVGVGGDPKTVHASSSEKGGVPKTDHSLRVNACEIAATYSPYRQGELATQTANTDSDSPGLNPDLAVSRGLDHVHSDGFPHSQISEVHDGLPSTRVFQGHEHSHGSLLDRLMEKRFTNSSSDNKDIAFSRVFRDDEMSEQLRQSDLKVQNLPSRVSSSELSAHQMDGTLADRFGHDRVDGRPPDSLSLQDRALLRRYLKVYCDEVVQNKSDGLRPRGDEPTRLIESASVEASCLEASTETVASPIPIAVTVFLPKTTWPMAKERDRKMESEEGDGTREKR